MCFKHFSLTAFALFFMGTSYLAHAQIILSGVLKNSVGEPVINATVTITSTQEETILGYAITNLDGAFEIPIEARQLELLVTIRSMGFKTMSTKIINKTQELSYVLEEEVTVLKDVVVRGNPIYKKGDTINYNVASFANPEDRTIGDVLKNMPGIEVLSDGKILYQGKPINKYYIEGLDLLEGKYNLANNNLPFGEVAKVQVLENHQPIKILDSLVFSEQAALNIKLKNSYTVTGQVKAGAGLAPLLREVNATPLLFTKEQQLIGSYQSNNVGNNVANDLKRLTLSDLREQFERSSYKQDWLSIQQLSTPQFTEERWLDNNVNIGTLNHLTKLKKDFELRTNISYINDYQLQQGFTNTQFFTPNGTITLEENN